MSNVKLIVTVPESHADAVREAMGNAGAGKIGNYDFCSFSSKGVGRFRPLDGAHPAIGTVGALEQVEEERIEVTCSRELLETIVSAIRAVHPYEESVIDVYPLKSSTFAEQTT